MIQIHMDRTSPPAQRKQDMCKIFGSTESLVYEICIALASIYQSMKTKDPAGAMVFRIAIGKMLDPKSSTWDLPIEKATIWGVNRTEKGKGGEQK